MTYTPEQVEKAIARGVKPDLQWYVDQRKKLMAQFEHSYLMTQEIKAKIAWYDEVICNNS